MEDRKILIKFEGDSDDVAFTINTMYCDSAEMILFFIQFLYRYVLKKGV